MDGKSAALGSGLILHYGLTLFIGMGLCNWGFCESLVDGTFILIIITAVVGTGLIAPAVWVCMILAALGCFNIYMIVPIITAFGLACCLMAEN